MEDNIEVFPFSKLVDKKEEEYYKAQFSEKEKLAQKLIFSPNISKNYLDEIIKFYDLNEKSPKDSVGMKFLYKNFNLHQFSLSKNNNKRYYNYFTSKTGKDLINKNHLKYLTENDPKNNFKLIINNFMNLNDNLEEEKQISFQINIIDTFLVNMFKVYNIDFNNITYFPPMKEYKNYSYNYFSRKILEVLARFRKKRKRVKFHLDKTDDNKNNENNTNNKNANNIYENYSTVEEKYCSYINIQRYFNIFSNLINNLGTNHEINIKIIKVMLFYLILLEITRDIRGVNDKVKIVVESFNSVPINEQILEKYAIFKINSIKKIEKKDWNSIEFNETVIIQIDRFNKISCKIKHFNTKILQLNDCINIINILENRRIEYLNMDGFFRNNFIQFEPQVENYLKNLLIEIFSSNIYIDNLIKYDLRFKNDNIKKVGIMKAMFKGIHKIEILEEIYNNILFIPFPLDIDFSGYTTRGYYSIYINSSNFSGEIKNPFVIIPNIHSSLNDIYHECSHNIFLLIAANLDNINYETINYTDINNELVNFQNTNINLYNIGYKAIEDLKDFGDIMEISLYGIKPFIFKTYSSLFFLDKKSFSLSINDFRNYYIKYYKSTKIISKKEIQKYENKVQCLPSSKDLQENLEIIKIFSSDFWKILSQFFPLKHEIRNEEINTENRARYTKAINNFEISSQRRKCFIERKGDAINIDFFLK